MLNSLINLHQQTQDYFSRAISIKYLCLEDDAIAYMTEVPIPEINAICIQQDTRNFESILIQGEQFYNQNNFQDNFTVIFPEQLYTLERENILKRMGYTQRIKTVAMAIQLENWPALSASNCNDAPIIQSTDDRLNEWIIPLIEAFESTTECGSKYVTAHQNALKKKFDFHHFSLYKQQKPITSITLSIHNGLARIDDLGTLPAFQKKGYATHLMTYVLSYAKQQGATYCFLESSDAGFSVYQKLGFEPLFQNIIYCKKI